MVTSDQNTSTNVQDSNNPVSKSSLFNEYALNTPDASLNNEPKESMTFEGVASTQQTLTTNYPSKNTGEDASGEPNINDSGGDESTVVIPSPSIAVSASSQRIPLWFLLLFGVTVIVFLGVTSLLIFSLSKQENRGQALAPIGQPTPSSIPSPSSMPTPTPYNPAQDAVIQLLGKQSDSDELPDIEADLIGTDVSTLEQGVSIIDSQIGFTP